MGGSVAQASSISGWNRLDIKFIRLVCNNKKMRRTANARENRISKRKEIRSACHISAENCKGFKEQ